MFAAARVLSMLRERLRVSWCAPDRAAAGNNIGCAKRETSDRDRLVKSTRSQHIEGAALAQGRHGRIVCPVMSAENRTERTCPALARRFGVASLAAMRVQAAVRPSGSARCASLDSLERASP